MKSSQKDKSHNQEAAFCQCYGLRTSQIEKKKRKMGEEAEVFSAPLVPVLIVIVHCPSYDA